MINITKFVLRYELLLREYVKMLSQLPTEHADLHDARAALKNIEETNVINNTKKRKPIIGITIFERIIMIISRSCKFF